MAWVRNSNDGLDKGSEAGDSRGGGGALFLMDWKQNGERGKHPACLYDLGLE